MRTVLSMEPILMNDCTVISLLDTSTYNPDLPIENAYLEVIPPNFSGYVQVSYQPQAVNVLNTQNLRLSNLRVDLPSGLYTITATIKPNDQLRETFYFLQTCKERQRLTELICQEQKVCGNVDELFLLHSELQVAMQMAAMDKPDEGVALFNSVSKKIRNYGMF